MSKPVVLLFGLPRSGTTWIGKIFDSHPQTLYLHEPDSWGRLNWLPMFPEGAVDPADRQRIDAFVATLPGAREAKVRASTPVFAKAYWGAVGNRAFLASVWSAKLLARLAGECPLPWVGRAGHSPTVQPVWKSIESLGRLRWLLAALPAARAIHLLRHPAGFVASVLRGESAGKFTAADPASEDFGLYEILAATAPARRRGLDLPAFKAMHPVERLAWRWVIYNEAALAPDLPDRCLPMPYENVCREPQAMTRRMFEFVGLEWAAQTECFISNSTRADKDNYYSVFKDPLKSANKWRDSLPADVVARIRAVVDGTAPGAYYAEAW
ncbi:MAG: sulfotransferase [Immundisolibacter sp.]|uniref:sulfotransferase n=1 Tax=Immundisolibacter sp. TaxID=1934948 RepID=UPI003D0BC61E